MGLDSVNALFKGLVKTVTTSGTRVQVATTPTWARGMILKAPAANSGVVYFGDVTVLASTGTGLGLSPGDIVHLDFASRVDVAIDLSKQYVDAVTSGDKLSIGYLSVV